MLGRVIAPFVTRKWAPTADGQARRKRARRKGPDAPAARGAGPCLGPLPTLDDVINKVARSVGITRMPVTIENA
jgi:hypothetical protein